MRVLWRICDVLVCAYVVTCVCIRARGSAHIGCRSLFTAASARGDTYDPRAAFMQATAEWHPRFSGSGLTPEDISLLGDFYYLPFEVCGVCFLDASCMLRVACSLSLSLSLSLSFSLSLSLSLSHCVPLSLLVLFFLVLKNGPAADALLACGREVLSAPRTTADPSRLLELQARCDAAARLYRCVTELHHRELSYTLLR
jgi:hypothetical protein